MSKDRLEELRSNRELAEAYAAGDESVYSDVLRISLSEGFTVRGWVRWYTGKTITFKHL